MRFIYMMMRGDSKLEKVRVVGPPELMISGERALEVTGAIDTRKRENQQVGKIEAFGLDIMKEEGGTE